MRQVRGARVKRRLVLQWKGTQGHVACAHAMYCCALWLTGIAFGQVADSGSSIWCASTDGTQVSAWDMQLADVLAGPLRPATKRSGLYSRDALLQLDGHAVVCVLIGTPQGRWHA